MPKPLINPNPQTGWSYGNYCFYYDHARNKIVRTKIYGTSLYNVTLRIPGLGRVIDDFTVPMSTDAQHRLLASRIAPAGASSEQPMHSIGS